MCWVVLGVWVQGNNGVCGTEPGKNEKGLGEELKWGWGEVVETSIIWLTRSGFR